MKRPYFSATGEVCFATMLRTLVSAVILPPLPSLQQHLCNVRSHAETKGGFPSRSCFSLTPDPDAGSATLKYSNICHSATTPGPVHAGSCKKVSRAAPSHARVVNIVQPRKSQLLKRAQRATWQIHSAHESLGTQRCTAKVWTSNKFFANAK